MSKTAFILNNIFAEIYRHLRVKVMFTYRVFIKYCVFSKNVQYFAKFPSPALGWDWFTENGQPIGVTVHSDLRSDELVSYMQENGKKHNF